MKKWLSKNFRKNQSPKNQKSLKKSNKINKKKLSKSKVPKVNPDMYTKILYYMKK